MLWLVDEDLVHATPGKDLKPAFRWHLQQGLEAIWDIGKGKILSGREVARPSEVLRNNISYRCVHGNSAVLELSFPSTIELAKVSVFAEAKRIKVPERWLHTQLIFEGFLQAESFRISSSCPRWQD